MADNDNNSGGGGWIWVIVVLIIISVVVTLLVIYRNEIFRGWTKEHKNSIRDRLLSAAQARESAYNMCILNNIDCIMESVINFYTYNEANTKLNDGGYRTLLQYLNLTGCCNFGMKGAWSQTLKNIVIDSLKNMGDELYKEIDLLEDKNIIGLAQIIKDTCDEKAAEIVDCVSKEFDPNVILTSTNDKYIDDVMTLLFRCIGQFVDSENLSEYELKVKDCIFNHMLNISSMRICIQSVMSENSVTDKK